MTSMTTVYARKYRLYRCGKCGRYFTLSEEEALNAREVTCPYCNNGEVEFMGEY